MLTLKRSSALKGAVTVPGDKSISHRSIMLGSIAKGDTLVTGFLNSADCLSTMDCFRRLGIRVDEDPANPGTLTVHGAGMHGLAAASSPVQLYTGNSGTTTRILSGLLSAQSFSSVLSGDTSVNKRPMKRVIDPLTRMGARIRSEQDNGCCPLIIEPSALHGIDYNSPVASAQVKSAILLAGLYADGPTSVNEPFVSRDHTERMLMAFGADVKTIGTRACVQPCAELIGTKIDVPGDISSAAFFIAAGLLVPGSDLEIRHVGANPTRAGILQVARDMGGSIDVIRTYEGTEPCVDLRVRASSLKGTTVSGSLIPTLIDELPVIAVMAAAAEGTTVIRDAAELKVKESDRIAVVTENLRAMGCNITPTDDGFVICGGKPLHGALIRTHKDHRIAMSFAVAAMIADGETVLDDPECAVISYPSFFSDLAGL